MPKLRSNSKGAGRPMSNLYSELDVDQKREYHSSKCRVSRNQFENQPANDDRGETSRSIGRPPLNSDSAMTPNTLKTRKRKLMAEIRRPAAVSKLRKAAANSRWQQKDAQCSSVQSEPEFQAEDKTEAVLSSRTVFRMKAKLTAALPRNTLDNLDVFISSLKMFPETEKIKYDNYNYLGNLTRRQRSYRVKMIKECITSCSTDVRHTLLKYWLEKLLSDSLAEHILDISGIVIPSELQPKSVYVSRISKLLSGSFLVRCRSCLDQRKQGILFVIAVAKQAELSASNHGDIQILASATSCSWKFAKTVLTAISTGKENELLNQNVRCDSIKASHWPREITNFVFQPENSRAVPGQEMVSVRYGVRRPKYLLLKSKQEIALAFKAQNPTCNFSLSTIIREFPQNAVSPTTRDMERNTCPVHANARRLIKCLRNAGIAKEISTSCRQIVSGTMCQSDSFDCLDPLTWNVKCVFGDCKSCPTFQLNCPSDLAEQQVTFSQWMFQKCAQKGKNVFGLVLRKLTLSCAITVFLEMLPKLRQHIYTAHHQWQAHTTARDNLNASSIITVEDYQQNLEVVYAEKPTSMAYSTNKVTVAVYPICIEYVDEDMIPQKGAIVFISDDKKHDFHQVAAFENRMFEIFREKHPTLTVRNWLRFSDACAAQFRSRKVNANLLKSKEAYDLDHVGFEYFEAHEGKNISDTIGSIVKCAFQRGIIKKNEGLKSVTEIVEVIKSELKDSSEKFLFFTVEEFASFPRVDDISEYPLPGIMSVHSLRLHKDGILAKKLSCIECKPYELCDICCTEKASVSVNDRENNLDIPSVYDSDDDGASDLDSESDTQDSDTLVESFLPGDIVWGKFGRMWYPAKVVHISDVPSHLQKSLQRSNGQDFVIVKWYGENEYSRLKIDRLDILAENKVDSSRAARSHNMQCLYQLALADLRED